MTDQDSLILESAYLELLEEARQQRYMQMFQDPIYTDNPKWFEEQIKWARRVLKKEDRIVWWLRWVKAYVLANKLEQGQIEMDHPEIKKIVPKYVPKGEMGEPLATHFPLENYKSQLEHFFTQELEIFQDYQIQPKEFPRVVLTRLKNLEDDYFKGAGDAIPMGKDDEIILRFNDGYMWVNTHKSTCDPKEAKIMQHCGNQYGHKQSGDEIFALRKTTNKKGLYEPKLTFVVNDGIVRESKGKQNEKPNTDKYGDYIFELMKTDYIKGFDQHDSHDAQSNFYLSDLTDEQQNALREIKGDEFVEDGAAYSEENALWKIYEEYQESFTDINVNFDVDGGWDGGTPYLMASASFSFDIPLKGVKIAGIADESQVDKAIWEWLEGEVGGLTVGEGFDVNEFGVFTYTDEKMTISGLTEAVPEAYSYSDNETIARNFLDECVGINDRVKKIKEDEKYQESVREEIIEVLMGMGEIETPTQMIISTLIDETGNYDEINEENFPSLEEIDIEYSEDDWSEYWYSISMETSQLPTNLESRILSSYSIENSVNILKQTRLSNNREEVSKRHTLEEVKDKNDPVYYIFEYIRKLLGLDDVDVDSFWVSKAPNENRLNISMNFYLTNYNEFGEDLTPYRLRHRQVAQMDEILSEKENQILKFIRDEVFPSYENPILVDPSEWKIEHIDGQDSTWGRDVTQHYIIYTDDFEFSQSFKWTIDREEYDKNREKYSISRKFDNLPHPEHVKEAFKEWEDKVRNAATVRIYNSVYQENKNALMKIQRDERQEVPDKITSDYTQMDMKFEKSNLKTKFKGIFYG